MPRKASWSRSALRLLAYDAQRFAGVDRARVAPLAAAHQFGNRERIVQLLRDDVSKGGAAQVHGSDFSEGTDASRLRW